MNRLRALLLVGLLVALAATSAASGQKTEPVLRRPNPLFVSLGLDYVNPIPAPGGGFAMFDPEQRAAISASVRDLKFLEYERRDDLGGFIPAPLGWLATGSCRPKVNLSNRPCPGITLLGGGGPTEITLYSHNKVSGKIDSFTWKKHHIGPPGPPCTPYPACTLIAPGGPFPNNVPVPSANGGFGGNSPPPKKPKPPVTVGPKGDCGTPGISIVSNLPHCQIYVVNQEPGDGTFEKMTITNTTNVKYFLSLKATGTPNRLWDDLEMGIWEEGTPAPTPLPPLRFWTQQFNNLLTLDPGQVVHYRIELFLPLTAGNGDQHLPAIIDFNWHAVQKPSG